MSLEGTRLQGLLENSGVRVVRAFRLASQPWFLRRSRLSADDRFSCRSFSAASLATGKLASRLAKFEVPQGLKLLSFTDSLKAGLKARTTRTRFFSGLISRRPACEASAQYALQQSS